MRKYKAILLAAGFGTRLKPATNIWPKCLMPIQGKPLLEYWITNLQDFGVTEILVNTHYMSETVEKFLRRDKFKSSILISKEIKVLGTAGTLRENRDFCEQSPVLIAHADNLCFCDFAAFMSHHEVHSSNGYPISMMSFDCKNPSDCGVIEVDSNGVVHRMHEKKDNPPGKLANGAVYIFEPEVLNWIARNSKVSDISTEVLPEYMGKITHWKNSKIHRDIGRIEDLIAAQTIEIQNQHKLRELPDDWQIDFMEHAIQKVVTK